MKEAAYVAKIIKAELKHKFPKIKFSVSSENFAGGDAVRVRFEKFTGCPTVRDIEAITNKYQSGHFDGMTDCYEYSNKTEGPTAKFISVYSDYPEAVHKAVMAEVPRGSYPEVYQRAYESKLVAMGY